MFYATCLTVLSETRPARRLKGVSNVTGEYCLFLLVGYDIVVAEIALIATKNKGIQPAIDW